MSQEFRRVTTEDVNEKRYDVYDHFMVEDSIDPSSHIVFYEQSGIADGY